MRIIDWNFSIETDILSLNIEKGTKGGFYARSQMGKISIICPPNTDFTAPQRQEFLHKAIVELLRKQAKMFLPKRVETLASLHQLDYKRLTIKCVHSKWGSCSSVNNINLSLYLMVLPSHLIDYVILHELCHTREKNHSPNFWALLDTMTSGKSKNLRKELNTYRSKSSPTGERSDGIVRVLEGEANEDIL